MTHKIIITVEKYDNASALYDLILELMLDQEIAGKMELGNRHSGLEFEPKSASEIEEYAERLLSAISK